jgi:branched-chain amino acid transport system substrate-binding protein
VQSSLVETAGCADQEYLSAAGDAANGTYFADESVYPAPGSTDPDVQLYVNAMQMYANVPQAKLAVHHEAAFTTTWELIKAIGRAGSNPTPASVLSALKATKNQPGLLSGPMTCDGTALPGFPTVCRANITILRRENGALKSILEKGAWITPKDVTGS